MDALKKITQVLAKVLEVGNWVAVGFMAVLFVLTLIPNDIYSTMLVQTGPHDLTLNVYGFEVVAAYAAGQFNKAAVCIFALAGIFICGFMAMVFRNVYLIIKFSRGEGRYSQGVTPFQKDITRMIREIGIFLLSVVVANLLFSTIASAVIGFEYVESSLNLVMLMMGLLMLCLSSAFAEGEALRRDVDGLL